MAGLEAALGDTSRGRRDISRADVEGGGRVVQGTCETPSGCRPGYLAGTPEAAVARLNQILAHAWMVRTFLKHADEIQGSEEMLSVPRTLYDSIRAVEPAYQRGDLPTYLRRLKGKLPKFRKAAEFYTAHFKE